jgi:hypothetical protein
MLIKPKPLLLEVAMSYIRVEDWFISLGLLLNMLLEVAMSYIRVEDWFISLGLLLNIGIHEYWLLI